MEWGARWGGVCVIDLVGVGAVPIRKVEGGYKWGKSGKVYPSKKDAQRQARAIYASGYGRKKKGAG